MHPARPSQPLRRPLIGLTLVFIAGTWGAVMPGNLPPAWLGAASVMLLILAMVCQAGLSLYQRRQTAVSIRAPVVPGLPRLMAGLATCCLYLAVGAGAWCVAGLRLNDPFPNALSSLMEKPRESVELEGVIVDDPVARSSWQGDRSIWTFPFQLESIRRLLPWQKARGTIQVSWSVAPGERCPRYGERWRLAGVLTDNARFPHDECVANADRPVLDWLRRRYTLWADPDAAMFFGAHQGAFVREACFDLRRRCAAALALGIGHRPDVVGLLRALLLGYRQELPEKLRNDFTMTGTYHIFAISGQHVAIISLFIIVILQSYRVSRVKWFLCLAPLLIVFTLATGMSTSAVRGSLMVVLCSLGLLIHRKPDVLSALALAALMILAVDPFQLFGFSFRLSFVVVTGLVVLCPPILRQVTPEIEPDPLRLQSEPTPVRWSRRVVRVVVFLFVTSVVAWLVSAPLIARWFNLVSPIALPANLVVIPMATLMLLAGCLALVFSGVFPMLSEIFNFANVVVVSVLLFILDGLARLPYGHVFVKSPPLWSLALWYGTLAAWVGWRQKLWVWVAGPILWVLVLGAVLIGAWNRVDVDLLNDGDYPVCFVNNPGRADWLIDTGSRYHVRKVIRHLRRQGVDRLQAVILSGVNSGRAGGTPELLRAMPVGELWHPPGAETSRAFRPTLELARDRGVSLRSWSNNASWAAEQAIPGTIKTALDLCVPGGGKKQPPAWILRRGKHAVLFRHGDSQRMTDAVREQFPDLQPTVLIENKMRVKPEHETNVSETKGWQSAWRVICTRALCVGNEGDSSGGDRVLCLAPGEGIRLRLDRDPVSPERLRW